MYSSYQGGYVFNKLLAISIQVLGLEFSGEGVVEGGLLLQSTLYFISVTPSK